MNKTIETLCEEIAGDPQEINESLRILIDMAAGQIGCLSEESAVDLAAYLNRRKAQLIEVADDAKSAISVDLDDGDVVIGNHWLLKCSLTTPSVFNSKRFKESAPDIYQDYCEPKPRLNRTFGPV